MSAARLDVMIWVLIYGGLLLLALGIALRLSAAGLGGAAVAVGAALVAGGMVLIGVRARRVRSQTPSAGPSCVPPLT